MDLRNIWAVKLVGGDGKRNRGGDGADDAWVCSLGEKLFSHCLPYDRYLINIYINTLHCHDDCFFLKLVLLLKCIPNRKARD